MRYRVVVDISSTQDQFAHRGVGNYTRSVLTEMIKQSGEEFEWHLLGFQGLLELRENLPIALDNKLRERSVVHFHSLGELVPSSVFNWWHYQTKYTSLLASLKPDLYFAPEFTRGFPLEECLSVVMVHDLIPYITGRFSPRGRVANYIKGLAYTFAMHRMAKATHLLTNSRFTSTEVMRTLKVSSDKITVTYLAPNQLSVVDESILETVPHKRYILYYGGLEQNKNVPLLVKSFKRIHEIFPDYGLVIVGKEFSKTGRPLTPEARELNELITSLNLTTAAHKTGLLSDHEVAALLKQADLFMHLSQYEGFGLAIVEAMSAGTPVIAANASCYPEIAMDGAMLVDLQLESIVEAVIRLNRNPKLREQLVRKGKRVAKQYNWQSTAAQTLSVFRSVIDASRK